MTAQRNHSSILNLPFDFVSVILLLFLILLPSPHFSELEEPCLLDLGKLCSENPEKGAEVDCLQEHYDKLTEDCQEAVKRVTDREADDIGQLMRKIGLV